MCFFDWVVLILILSNFDGFIILTGFEHVHHMERIMKKKVVAFNFSWREHSNKCTNTYVYILKVENDVIWVIEIAILNDSRWEAMIFFARNSRNIEIEVYYGKLVME